MFLLKRPKQFCFGFFILVADCLMPLYNYFNFYQSIYSQPID